jgi:Tfp pilus assembly pilus retraction ATPase PilT
MLADALKAVVAQQLLKTADGKGRCAANEVLITNAAILPLPPRDVSAKCAESQLPETLTFGFDNAKKRNS